MYYAIRSLFLFLVLPRWRGKMLIYLMSFEFCISLTANRRIMGQHPGSLLQYIQGGPKSKPMLNNQKIV